MGEVYKLKYINKEYVKRSRLFLYPLLYIPSDCVIQPDDTYIGWVKDGKEFIKSTDCKLICVYSNINTPAERKAEKQHLLMNRYFEDIVPLENGKMAYVFKITRNNIKQEWKMFLEGKYSRFNNVSKTTITNFYDKEPMKTYIDTYFYPEDYYDVIAKVLDISLEVVMESDELLSKPDINIETLVT